MPETSYPRAGWRWPGRTATVLLVGGALATSGCSVFGGKRRQARVFNPPPVMAKVPEPSVPIEYPPAPNIEPVITASIDLPGGSEIPSPAPPPRPAPPVKPVKSPEAAATSVAPPTPAAPKPVQIFSVDEQRTYNREFEESMQRVKDVLAKVAGRNLTPEQRDIYNRIRTFQTQAEQARGSDLLTAVSLARRADLLARDLLGRLP